MTELPAVDHPNKLLGKLWVVSAFGLLLPPLVFVSTFDQPNASDSLLLSLFISTAIGFVVLLILSILKRNASVDLNQRKIRIALWLALVDGIGGILFSWLLAVSSVR